MPQLSTTRRQALALAAALTLAVGTGVAAVAGLAHRPAQTGTAATQSVVATTVTQAPASAREADD